MSAVPQELRMIFNRSIWLYAAVALVFAFAVDYPRAAKQRGHYLIGIFYNEDLQNFKDGVVYFDYLIHHKPNDPYNYFLLGYCYARLEDYRRAVRYFEEAIRRAPAEKAYVRYLDYAKAKLADSRADVALPPDQIVIPIEAIERE